MGLPKFAIVDVLDPLPDASLGVVLMPTGSQVSVIKAEHLRCQPGGNMHAVGNVSDWNRVFMPAGIQPGPHGAGHLAVQSRNGIGAARKF